MDNLEITEAIAGIAKSLAELAAQLKNNAMSDSEDVPQDADIKFKEFVVSSFNNPSDAFCAHLAKEFEEQKGQKISEEQVRVLIKENCSSPSPDTSLTSRVSRGFHVIYNKKPYYHGTAISIVIRVIIDIGVEKVAQACENRYPINYMNDAPMVMKKSVELRRKRGKSEGEEVATNPIGNSEYKINSGNSSKRKKRFLEQLARALGLDLIVIYEEN